MSAIFGFTFHMGRMTEVLTPDIYRAHWPKETPRGLLSKTRQSMQYYLYFLILTIPTMQLLDPVKSNRP